MITNEQILEILKTWPIYNGFLYDKDVTLRLVNSTQQYLMIFSKHIAPCNGTTYFKFQLSKIKDLHNDDYTFILERNVPSNIQLEVEYLMTTKVKEYIKSELDKMFSNKEANGFDALMND